MTFMRINSYFLSLEDWKSCQYKNIIKNKKCLSLVVDVWSLDRHCAAFSTVYIESEMPQGESTPGKTSG